MSSNISTTFQHVSQVGDTLLNCELESNLKSYLDWGMLGIGGWFNVNILNNSKQFLNDHKLNLLFTYENIDILNDELYPT